MPPVYAQQNDAANRARARAEAQSHYTAQARSLPRPSGPPSIAHRPTTAVVLASSPTTAERLASQPTALAAAVGSTSSTPATEHSALFKTNLFKKDLLESSIPSGGTQQRLRNDYVFSPSTRSFVEKPFSNSFAPRQNTIELFGGTSDTFRYNNSASQKPDTKTDVTVGDTLWKAGGLTGFGPNYQDGGSVGNDNLGASANISAGLHATANASYKINSDSVTVGAQGEVFYGVKANAEAHAALGPVDAKVSAEAKAGAGIGGNAGLRIDPRNGLSAELGAEAFAGVEAKLAATTGIGDSAEVTGGVDLKAGIGAEAKADVEFGLNEVGIDLEIGATLGIGADVKIDLAISPSGIIDDAGDVIDGAKKIFSVFG